jgi:hypothetical protein
MVEDLGLRQQGSSPVRSAQAGEVTEPATGHNPDRDGQASRLVIEPQPPRTELLVRTRFSTHREVDDLELARVDPAPGRATTTLGDTSGFCQLTSGT